MVDFSTMKLVQHVAKSSIFVKTNNNENEYLQSNLVLFIIALLPNGSFS